MLGAVVMVIIEEFHNNVVSKLDFQIVDCHREGSIRLETKRTLLFTALSHSRTITAVLANFCHLLGNYLEPIPILRRTPFKCMMNHVAELAAKVAVLDRFSVPIQIIPDS